MNKTALRNFAVIARKDLINRVELQAYKVGITKENVAEAQMESSDAIIINGQTLTSLERRQRNQLINRIEAKGYDQVIEEVAYTWFNRFVALRFMEVNDYLPTRVRVLSSESPTSTEPDMIKEALSLDLDIDKEKVYDFKLNNKTDELFKYLIQLHCNDLNKYMPFMFETLEDYMMILFPEGLLGTESFVREMTNTELILEDNWEQVEIIGWLYQYYISEENQRLIQAKKQYKPEELPAATQLFTPDWIVKYMVQNALGRYWVESHPNQSDLVENWEFYLQNREEDYAEKIKRFANSDLNIEEITCFDPAMGSGHILVYMFDVLYEIYEKNGYMPREIPRLIIENNLYGLDIDDRAYQLASFSVVMKALQYNRRFLRSIERHGLNLNLAVIKQTNDIGKEEIAFLAGEQEQSLNRMNAFIDQFKDAKSIGSLLKINEFDPEYLNERLEGLNQEQTDIFTLKMKENTLPLLTSLYKQARIMDMKHDVFITNPPYAGNRYIPANVKSYLKDYYPDVNRDLFSSFIEYSFSATKENGQIGFMTPFVWMFISSNEKLRNKIINERTISSLIQLEYSGFDGATVPICTFTLRNYTSDIQGEYVRLDEFRGAQAQPIKTLEAVSNPDVSYRYTFDQVNFDKIPGSPIAYWAKKNILDLYNFDSLGKRYELKEGIGTRNDATFIKYHWEVSNQRIGREGKRWILTDKAGGYRKWFMGCIYVMDWENNGERIKNYRNPDGTLKSRPQNTRFLFKEGVTWGKVSSGDASFRWRPAGYGFNDASPTIFGHKSYLTLLFLNSNLYKELLGIQGETLNRTTGLIGKLPFIELPNTIQTKAEILVESLISISENDWNLFEISFDFEKHPILKYPSTKIQKSYNIWEAIAEKQFGKAKENEIEHNDILIEFLNLEKQLSSDVKDDDISITKADLERDIKSFISYAVGCVLGRYSLDEDGLIYAGGEFDPSRYKTFPADKNNILPILPDSYYEDDIVSLFVKFIETTYGPETLEGNLTFVAEAIGERKNESARDGIRRYFLNNFYKDHAQTYKKHPIYWQFTSGKEKAFNCLIYMHRYDKTTLSRIRIDYLHEVQARYETIKSDLQYVIDSDANASEVRQAKKELTSVDRKIEELKVYDEKLHHMADMQIEIDLDDGVKVNYKKFEGLVAKI